MDAKKYQTINKSVVDLISYVKDSVSKDLLMAAQSQKITLKPEQVRSVIALTQALIDKAYMTGAKGFDSVLKSVLAEPTDLASRIKKK